MYTITMYYGSYNNMGRLNELFSATNSVFKTTMVDAVLEVSTVTDAYVRNRVVKEKKEVMVSGKTYTAYLIHEEIWTSSGECEIVLLNRW